MFDEKEYLKDLACSEGFIDRIIDLPYETFDENVEYIEEQFAEFYLKVYARLARHRDFKRNTYV